MINIKRKNSISDFGFRERADSCSDLKLFVFYMGHSGEYGNKRHLGTEKTKIQNILDLGKIDVFSVRTNIYIKNKKMGHLI